MSWIEKLYETYEANSGTIPKPGEPWLVPPFHTLRNVHIAVGIDESGNFCGATLFADGNLERIIPCTEGSDSRTHLNPHPLFDILQYVAGDFCEHVCFPAGENVKKLEKKMRDSHALYMKSLAGWCKENPMVDAVHTYLQKKTLLRDLMDFGIVPVDKTGKGCYEKQQAAQGKSLFALIPGDLSGTSVVFEIWRKDGVSVRLWEDKSVRESWAKYIAREITASFPPGFCQILGRTAPLARLHPKRVRNAADGARLISANDGTNFTFRGRFENWAQASGISMEATQKAHSALRWLLKKQGSHVDSQYMVAWSVGEDTDVPSAQKNTYELCSLEAELGVSDAPIGIGSAENAAKELNKLFAGYGTKLNAKTLCVILLDSASPGTMAVKSYRELEGWRYLANVENWHKKCAWLQRFSADVVFYGAPSPKDIVRAAYGAGVQDSDSRCRAAVERLLPCIWDAKQVPGDLLALVLRRVSNPAALGKHAFRKTLGIACSLYKYNHSTERTYTMELEESLRNRDYLYGRLLALADYLEDLALGISEKDRPTNAMRCMPQFAKQPYSTWNTLFSKLAPYRERLRVNKSGRFVFLEKKFAEVFNLFAHEEYTSDKPLSGEYIMGYYCQKDALYASSKENTDNEPNEGE